MRWTTRSYLILAVFYIYTTVLDILVSYTVFKYNMVFFLSHEGNKEFAYALAYHTIPFQTIMINILILIGYTIVLILVNYLLNKQFKSKYFELTIHTTSLTCYILASFTVLYLSILHILGALSWI